MRRVASGSPIIMIAVSATTGGVDVASAQENLSEVEFTPHFIRISEKGGFLQKTWPQLNTPEFKAAVGVACAALGCAPLVTTILGNVGKIPIASGEDYATSGHIDKQAGEEWWISFPPPAGYTTCSADYDSKTISANKGDATSSTVYRGPKADWVGSYNEVPKHRPEGIGFQSTLS